MMRKNVLIKIILLVGGLGVILAIASRYDTFQPEHGGGGSCTVENFIRAICDSGRMGCLVYFAADVGGDGLSCG